MKNFKKFFKKKGYDRKVKISRKQSDDKNQVGCHKYDKTDHMIKNGPICEIEWKKEIAEKELKEKTKK